MEREGTPSMAEETEKPAVTGRCYCGAITIRAAQAPETVAYCHCADCRRVTVAAFAAFDEGTVTFTPDEGRRVTVRACRVDLEPPETPPSVS